MPSPVETLIVTLGDTPPDRLDKALAQAVPEAASLSRSRLARMIADGAVSRWVTDSIREKPQDAVLGGCAVGSKVDAAVANDFLGVAVRFWCGQRFEEEGFGCLVVLQKSAPGVIFCRVGE